MRKKLFLSYIILVVITAGIVSSLLWYSSYTFLRAQSNEYYLMQAKLIGEAFEESALQDEVAMLTFVERYAKNYNLRITLIEQDGDVLADSQKSGRMENHASREEVKAALNGKAVTISRYSETMHQEYSYSAVPVENSCFSGVIRISLPVSELKLLWKSFVNSILLSGGIAFVIAIVAAFVLSTKMSRPMEEVTEAAERISAGNYDTVILTKEKEQIGRLAEAFNRMVSNLKDTIEKLRSRNIELEAMLRSINGAVVAIDENDRIIFYNQAFASLVGAEERNLYMSQLYGEIRSEEIFEIIRQARSDEANQCKEGTWNEKEIRSTATPLIGEEKILGVLIIIEDLTDIRKLENVRSDFVSNVTHELKTPLTSIRGFVDTLKNGAIDNQEVAVRFLDIIDIETERLYSLIQDILLLSEIETKQDYEVVPCNVEKVIQEALALLQPKVSEHVMLVYQPEPYIRPYYCNPDRLKELLINLLDNALKYTEQGTVHLECREEEDALLISVTDTGIGMERKHLSRIFERFYRVDKGRSRKKGGTGLGLSIVKHIVELYNGTIKVESEPEKGTSFRVYLPY